MNARDADLHFRSRLKRAGLDLDETTPRQGFEALLAFYREERAEDVVLEEEGDMLLFEWGSLGRDESERFYVDLTRQLIAEPGGDDNFLQLALTYVYELTADIEALGQGNDWCHHPAEEPEFVEELLASEPFEAVGEAAAAEIRLSFDVVG